MNFHFAFTLSSEYTFYSNRNLTYVNLEWNRIELLPRQIFHPDIHQQVSQLRLSHNKISTVLSDSFLSFPGVNIDLSYNSIQTVDRYAFTTARNFPPELSSRVPETFSSESPQDAEPLAQQPSSTSPFSSWPGLNLFLNRNKLIMMKPNAFAQEKFSLLDLSYNQLVQFNFDTFSRNTIIGGLNLSHNSIERLGVPKGRRFVMKFLDLSNNKLGWRGAALAMPLVCPTDFLDLSNNRLEKTEWKLFPTNCSLRVSSAIVFFRFFPQKLLMVKSAEKAISYGWILRGERK